MEGYANDWNKPEELMRIRKLKTKKRALQDRLFDESPSKKTKRQQKAKRLFKAQPPPPDEATCEDSTLMDLISMKQPTLNLGTPFTNSTGERTPTSCLSASLSPSPPSSSSMSPHRHSIVHSNSNQGRLPNSSMFQHSAVNSPMKSYLPSLSSFSMLSTPPSVEKKRQRITPAPAITSPLWASSSHSSTPKSARRGLDLSRIDEKSFTEEKWHKELCMDWSVKTRLLIRSENQFGWNTALKTSEESSGISAFVRCIDMEPNQPISRNFSPPGSQLDTSLGAQFHQCCLYWQHPYLPTVKLFPRESTYGVTSLTTSTSAYAGNIKLEERALDTMFLEWVDSFRSAFQLLRTRQCPYFYIFGNQFTCLFSAAGTQGLECLQIYVTPSSKGFRDSLKKEGIEYTLPYHEPGCEAQEAQVLKTNTISKELDSDDEPDKWLDEMGISQDLSVSLNVKTSPTNSDEKGKSTLLMITGESSLAFFNFLINSRSFLVTNTGVQSGLPPTIVSPVAFQGASLRSLTVKQSRSKKPNSDMAYTMELIGPILPYTIHMLCGLLNKTVKNYEIIIDTMASTKPMNVNRQVNSPKSKHSKPNAFDIQNLSDCGSKRSLLETLCRSDIIDTLISRLECQNLMYKWS
ncbi:unnamed protein product [Orchesella dallaii]|uniref:Protein downstream neighbor of Son n=2 Tax=Orchesella dallaii TaxID=48710 RepID=A0ABP1QG74_9HEXA